MKKRILTLIMVMVMILSSMAVCASGEEAVKLTDEEITLTVWHIAIDENRHQAVKNAIARFEEKYPNIHVEEVANENDPYKTKLATAMAAGQEPDVFISWGGGWLKAFIDEGKVLDINDKVEAIKDEYYESALSLFQLDGKYYGLPYSCGPAPVYYNKQIYADLGLEVPETLSEFEANCDKIKEAGITPLALGNASQWPGALTFIYLSLRKGGKDAFLNAYNRENGGTFEDPSFIWA
ncbi:MAG: extracellular solute-binding protein, partial [Lachnospiraceae bacterium]|nr:extracellular solute-binding protein [Lachnospiraceae bacterium]